MTEETVQVRQERAARNQSLFREVNERIESVVNKLSMFQEFICECARTDCGEQVSLTLAEYEAIRAHPARFAVKPGHVVPDVERVVDAAAGRYEIVEKIGEAAELAGQLDPRAKESA